MNKDKRRKEILDRINLTGALFAQITPADQASPKFPQDEFKDLQQIRNTLEFEPERVIHKIEFGACGCAEQPGFGV